MSYFQSDLQTPIAVTASGKGGTEVPVPTATMLTVTLDVTAVSGTTPTAEFWLEGYDKTAGKWFVIVPELRLKDDDTAAEPSAEVSRINARNISGPATVTAIGKFVAVFKHVCVEKVRGAWKIGGTTPSFTFTMGLQGK